jgi:3-oxosteroid 1-dehydrogenase
VQPAACGLVADVRWPAWGWHVDAGTFDVIVLGTGAAGLTAAVRAAAAGARVGLFEKAETVGGTSAWSGGTVWLPNNRHEVELGFDDGAEQVLTYLMSLSHGLMEQPLVAAYVAAAPEVAAWLEDNTAVEFEVLRGMSDYHPEHPGGKREGRSLECPLFPFAELGEWAERVTVGWQLTGEITMSESSLGRKAPGGVPPEELARRKIRDEPGAGQALVGRLLKGCLDRGVVPQTGCAGNRLLVEDATVVGVKVNDPDGPFEARARWA